MDNELGGLISKYYREELQVSCQTEYDEGFHDGYDEGQKKAYDAFNKKE